MRGDPCAVLRRVKYAKRGGGTAGSVGDLRPDKDTGRSMYGAAGSGGGNSVPGE